MPLTHTIGKTGVEHALSAQEIEYLGPQPLAQCLLGQWSQYLKRPGGQKYAVSDQRMDVRVESDEIAKCLHSGRSMVPGPFDGAVAGLVRDGT